MIYFIAEDQDAVGPVKIGYTGGSLECVRARLRTLQAGTWRRLLVVAIAPGRRVEEQAIHSALSDYRVRGEWFSRSDTLNALLSEHAIESPIAADTDLSLQGNARSETPMMTVCDLAERLQTTEGDVRRLAHDDLVPHVRYGAGTVRFNREAIERWISERTRGEKIQEKTA